MHGSDHELLLTAIY